MIEVADAGDPAALARAIRGAATVVNLTTGAPAGIVRTTKAIFEACCAAGARRLVHLSSAVVYGTVESPDVNDDSPPDTRHWMPYARAKADSEVWLRGQMPAAPCEVIVLRPGLVWGARSPHTLSFMTAILGKKAYLVDGGKWVFNAIHVDNLVACIQVCHEHRGNATGFYNVADREALTWRDFYEAFAPSLGCEVGRLPSVLGDRFPWSAPALVDYFRSLPLMSDLYHRLKAGLPENAKARIKGFLSGRCNYEGVAASYATKPLVDRELWSLQRVKHKLPTRKFERQFGFIPPVSFEEGARRALSWLRALGYAPSQTEVSRDGEQAHENQATP